ncbi:MAG: hypothetical protein J0H68_01115 [Sphingobacteriia bacterium]|nr:hypothetical protein [Sphingobacteriia bacterium]
MSYKHLKHLVSDIESLKIKVKSLEKLTLKERLKEARTVAASILASFENTKNIDINKADEFFNLINLTIPFVASSHDAMKSLGKMYASIYKIKGIEINTINKISGKLDIETGLCLIKDANLKYNEKESSIENEIENLNCVAVGLNGDGAFKFEVRLIEGDYPYLEEKLVRKLVSMTIEDYYINIPNGILTVSDCLEFTGKKMEIPSGLYKVKCYIVKKGEWDFNIIFVLCESKDYKSLDQYKNPKNIPSLL